MKSLFMLCLVVLLAGCGAAATQNGGTPIPTVDVVGITAGSFKATVSGAMNGDFSGVGGYFKQEEGGMLISLVATEGPPGATVTIILPAGTVSGVYSPKPYDESYDSDANKITAIGASFSIFSSSNAVDTYAVVSEGTLTLQTVDPITGMIHFKARMESGGEVEVTATFYQLSVI